MPDAVPMEAATLRGDAGAKERAKRFLWQMDIGPPRERQAYLYAILDAARDKRIYPTLRRLARTEQVLGLYQGRSATELAAVAPYLVCLGITDRVFDWLWDEGWGESWGVFLWSLVSPDTLRAHFRRLTMVRNDAGERLLFRFYDPRVLGEFLPTCDAAQLREMFGPVQRFMLERDGGREIASFRARSRLAWAAGRRHRSGARSGVNVADRRCWCAGRAPPRRRHCRLDGTGVAAQAYQATAG